MKLNTKKILVHSVILASALFIFAGNVQHANAGCVSTATNYCMLAPLPGLGSSVDTTTGVGNYFNTLIKFAIGIMSVLAVIMIVIGGIQYMVSDVVTEKSSAKNRITNAIFGLILALSSYLILNTINPKLVNLTIGVPIAAIQPVPDGVLDPTLGKLTFKNADGTYINAGDVLCDVTKSGAKHPQQGNITVNISVGGGASQTATMFIKQGGPWPNDNGTPVVVSQADAITAFPEVTDAFSTTVNYGSGIENTVYKGISILSDDYRGSLSSRGVTVERPFQVMHPGDSGVTSVYNVPTSTQNNLAKLKADCVSAKGSSCQVIITGGTECWLHSSHGAGLTPVDVKSTGPGSVLAAFIQSGTRTCESWNAGTGGLCDSSGAKHWQYVTDGMTFMDEGDHFHMK